MKPDTQTPWSDPSAPFDLEQLRQALQRGLPGCADGSLLLDELRVLSARRSSSRQRDPHPIVLWLEADLREAASGRVGAQRLFGKVYRDGASAAGIDGARATATTRPDFGAPVVHVPELDMLLWAWPNDPGLPQLGTLLDPARAAAHLPPDPLHGRLPVLACDVLRYVPQTRATLRYVQRVPGNEGQRVVYGKTFVDDRAPALLQRFEHFWRVAQLDPTAPLVAQPLGCDSATRTLWQAAARGVPLLDRARQAGAGPDFFAVGLALAHVHAAALPTDQQRPLTHWLAEVRRRQTKIARAAPALAARALAVSQALELASERLPASVPSLIHGDFHPEQIWIDDGRVVLFDFDEFCLGHPMEDLAGFIVKLEQTPLPAASCDALTQALLDGYARGAPERLCPATLAWQRAVQALLQVSRAFIFQRPDWQQLVELRLTRTETLLRELAT